MSKNNNKRTNRNSTMVQEKPVKKKEANADRKKAIAEKLERKKAEQTKASTKATIKGKPTKNTDIVELAKLGKLDVNSLEKPAPEDKEATRKYYEALSVAKANKGFTKLPKEKSAKKVKNNHIKRSHVKPNVFVRFWTMLRTVLTKDLGWKDWWKIVVGLFAVVVILSMVVLPLLSLFSWRNYLGLGLF